ncbi:MAG: hypothetical protein RLZZ15_1048 [Verrucomicrobiota bacterium]|jgi:putative methyltransferase (TIGR04325 family)
MSRLGSDENGNKREDAPAPSAPANGADEALAIAARDGEIAAVPAPSTLKPFMRALLPAGARRRLRDFRLRRVFTGDYATWADARAASAGYDDGAVLQKVIAATREVAAGRALWERDGVAFTAPETNAPLLAALRAIAAAEGGRLELVDFGGALGSTWWQHRAALRDLASVRWRVVEQPHFVAAGREFADGTVSFHATLRDALGAGPASTLLCSGVLQYLEQPAAVLVEAAEAGLRHVIFDRVSFATDDRERLAVQRPPADLGGAYPCRLFDRAGLLGPLGPRYRVVSEWTALDDYPGATFRGLHLTRSA